MCVYICVCVVMYIYVYIYIHVYTYIHGYICISLDCYYIACILVLLGAAPHLPFLWFLNLERRYS